MLENQSENKTKILLASSNTAKIAERSSSGPVFGIFDFCEVTVPEFLAAELLY